MTRRPRRVVRCAECGDTGVCEVPTGRGTSPTWLAVPCDEPHEVTVPEAPRRASAVMRPLHAFGDRERQRPHRHRAQRTRQEVLPRADFAQMYALDSTVRCVVDIAECSCGATRRAWGERGPWVPARCECGATDTRHVGRHSGMPRCCVCYRSDTSGTPEHGTCQHGEVRS